MFQGGGSMITTFLPFLLIFGVFYFLIIVPQRKRQKALADMVAALKPGDKVITSGGIYATIKQVKDKSLVVMSADKSILEISRSSVAGMQGEGGLTDATLTNASGFNGADGLFRFRPDGQNERGLAVMQVRANAASVVSPAPRSFAASNGT